MDFMNLKFAGYSEPAVDAAVALKLLRREEAAHTQDRIDDRRRVALGEHEAVAIRILRVFRVDAERAEVQRCQDLRAGVRAAEMAGRCAVCDLHGRFSGARRKERKAVKF